MRQEVVTNRGLFDLLRALFLASLLFAIFLPGCLLPMEQNRRCNIHADCDGTDLCIDNVCQTIACNGDEECPGSLACLAGLCTEEQCQDNSECDALHVCAEGFCQWPCELNNECECSRDAQCGDDFCSGNPVCVRGECVGLGNPCDEGSEICVASRDYCKPVSAEAQCSEDGDCDDGVFCNGVDTCV